MTAQRPLVEATALPLVRFVCSLFPLFLSTLFLSVLLLSPHFFLHPRFFFFYLSTFYSPPVYPQPPVLLPVKLTFPLLFFKSVIFPPPSIPAQLTYSQLMLSNTVSIADSVAVALLSPGRWDVRRRRFSFQLSNQGIILHLVNAINSVVGQTAGSNVAPEDLGPRTAAVTPT